MSSTTERPATTKPRIAEPILAAGVVVAFCYWAETVVITLVLSILLTYLLDPLVGLVERLRVPRSIASLLAVAAILSLLTGGMLLLGGRLGQLGQDWSGFSRVLGRAISVIEADIDAFLRRVGNVEPTLGTSIELLLGNTEALRAFFFRQLNSLSSALEIGAFVPFLAFFMLSEKNQLLQASLALFPVAKQEQVRGALEELSLVLRGYLMGNVFVAAVLVLASWVFFIIIGLDYPFLTALLSGLANLVPYLGALFAWIPPFAVGLTQWHFPGMFVLVAIVLTVLHLVSLNALFPVLVGRRVRVNATAVTVSILFWGWLWGAVGFLLAIPIIAAVKVVCDHVESWQPIGQWLGTEADANA